MSLPFIDIHTHSKCDDGNICIKNIFAEVQEADFKGFYSIGMHPWYLESEKTIEEGIKIAEKKITHKNCLAVGEAGLDKITDTDWELQSKAFMLQAKLAEKYQKPMIIHCVKAYSDILSIRKDFTGAEKWIFHGYNSSPEMASQLISHNCIPSFGNELFRQDSKAIKAFLELSSDHFFLETDDDDDIKAVYKRAADLRNISVEELKTSQMKNFRQVFSFDSETEME